MRRPFRHANWAVTLWLLLVGTAMGDDLRLPHVFSDNMVLQQHMPIRVWGWAEPSSKVTVRFARQVKDVVAAADGKWLAQLEPLTASFEARRLLVESNDRQIELKNMLVGEVWLCGGQSNMEWGVRGSYSGDLQWLSRGNDHIRSLKIPHLAAPEAQDDFQPASDHGQWQVCRRGEMKRDPTAVGYFFAIQLHGILDVPVGIVDNSWGGTVVETWVPRSALETLPAVRPFIEQCDARNEDWQHNVEKYVAEWETKAAEAKRQGKRIPRKPTDPARTNLNPGHCFNGMVSPICHLAIRGVLFYQGENNAYGVWGPYRESFPQLIKQWRAAFGQERLPLGVVGLSGHYVPDRTMEPEVAMFRVNGFSRIRDVHFRTFRATSDTGYIATYDLGHRSIHPGLKREIGDRCARWALAKVYGQLDPFMSEQPEIKSLAYTGPVYVSHAIQDRTVNEAPSDGDGDVKVVGKKIVLSFEGARPRKRQGETSPLRGFMIAGEDQRWYPAEARIVEEVINLERGWKAPRWVEVWNDNVRDPVAVRYAWNEYPENANLVGERGLPAPAFRTDDWPLAPDPENLLNFFSEENRPWRQWDHTRIQEAQRWADERIRRESKRKIAELEKKQSH